VRLPSATTLEFLRFLDVSCLDLWRALTLFAVLFSCSSEAPDIRNWFSSYEYESPEASELAVHPGAHIGRETPEPFAFFFFFLISEFYWVLKAVTYVS
jgi:hypothetical protein